MHNKPHTAATTLKMSATLRRLAADPERKKRMVAAQRKRWPVPDDKRGEYDRIMRGKGRSFRRAEVLKMLGIEP